jgi:hypothetical protein
MLISACGGSGSSTSSSDTADTTTSPPSVDVPVNADAFTSDYFSIVENGFDTYLTHSLAPNNSDTNDGILKVINQNNDGYPDLLHTSFHARGGYDGNDQSYAVINYYENNKMGGYVNKTIQVFGTQDTDTTTRKIQLLDINNDGKEDIFLANSREDGRLSANIINVISPNNAYISQPDGTYQKLTVGDPAWSHDVRIGDIDSDGIYEFIDGNFTIPTRVYDIHTDGSWSDTTDQTVNAIAFVGGDNAMADFNGDGCLDAFSNSAYPKNENKSFYLGDCSGGFTLEQEYTAGYTKFTVPGIAWTGEQSTFNVIDINGLWVGGINTFWSHAADFDNDGDIDILYALDSFYISEEEKNNNFITEGGEGVFTELILMKNSPSGFKIVNNPISNFTSELNILFTTFADINGDGYLDMVVDNHNGSRDGLGLNDVIFLNKGNGEFEKLDVVLAEGEIIDRYTNVVPVDVNQDNFTDFILRQPCMTCSGDAPFLLLLGKKKLPIL